MAERWTDVKFEPPFGCSAAPGKCCASDAPLPLDETVEDDCMALGEGREIRVWGLGFRVGYDCMALREEQEFGLLSEKDADTCSE
jgi:hypothetical protein